METKSKQVERKSNEKLTLIVKILLGIFLFLCGTVFTYLIFALWPTLETSGEIQNWVCKSRLFGGLFKVRVSGEACLILLVILSSCLGGFVYIASSFVYHVGNKTFTTHWVFWYVIRLFIGIALALIFYFVLRGGLLTTTGSSQFINPFGIAGVGGLVGLFSKQATEKLKEVFDTVFQVKTSGDDT